MNSFTRLCCNPQTVNLTLNNDMPQSLTSGNTGVQSRTDQVDSGRVSFHVTGDVSVDGRMHIKEVLGDEFLKVSDARLKENIKELKPEESVRIIRELAGVSFEYKSSGNKSVGYLAQQAERVDPQLIRKNNGGFYAMDYSSVGVHTTIALQELLKKIEHLETKLTEKGKM